MIQTASLPIQGGSGTKRLGEGESTHGTRKEGAGKGILRQLG